MTTLFHPSSAPADPSNGMVYLAAPYSDPDPQVREARYEQVTSAAANLIAQGHVVFSPITLTHPIDRLLANNRETLGSDFWAAYDEEFMRRCSALWVLMIGGWEHSRGIEREIVFFRSAGLPILFLDPGDLSKRSYSS